MKTVEIDEETIVNLITENKLKLYKTAKSILKNEDDVCDALQEALISIYKNKNKLKAIENFNAWSQRIIVNKCYDIIKKNKKIIYLEDQQEIENLQYKEEYKSDNDLEWLLKQIDEDLKTIVILYYYDDLQISEISKILNIAEGTVKSRLFRARKQLYEILKQEEGGMA